MKRFYTDAATMPLEGGFAPTLDGKPIHTPKKHKIIVPNEALAAAIAAEWAAQGDKVDKHTLPLTSFSSLTLDVVTTQRQSVIDEFLEYGETDLLFYREDTEEELQKQQTELWQPWVTWAEQIFDTHYNLTAGILPVAQDTNNKNKHSAIIDKAYSDWQIAGLAVIVKASTSLILGHAFMQKEIDAEQLFLLSRLEEQANINKWGEDSEAKIAREKLRVDLADLQVWRDLVS